MKWLFYVVCPLYLCEPVVEVLEQDFAEYVCSKVLVFLFPKDQIAVIGSRNFC